MRFWHWVGVGIILLLGVLVVSYYSIFGGNKIGFVSWNVALKWDVERVEVAKIGDYYAWRNGVERVVFLLSDKLEIHPGEAVGVGLGQELYYAKRKKVGSTMIIWVYIDQEEYIQQGGVLRDQLMGRLVTLQLTRGVGIEKEDERGLYGLMGSQNYYLVGLRKRL